MRKNVKRVGSVSFWLKLTAKEGRDLEIWSMHSCHTFCAAHSSMFVHTLLRTENIIEEEMDLRRSVFLSLSCINSIQSS